MLILHEEFGYKKDNLKSLWYFYKCYNFAIVIIGYHDPLRKRKNRLWKDLLRKISKGEDESREYNKLAGYIPKDMAIVKQAINEIIQEKIDSGQDQGNFWKKNYLALPFHEVE